MLMNTTTMKSIITAIIALLFSANISYAEVMDKEPSIEQIYIYGLIGTALLFFTARLKPWLLILVAPLPVIYFVGIISEINDTNIGPAILSEAGISYVISTYAFTVLLIASVIVGICMHRKKSET